MQEIRLPDRTNWGGRYNYRLPLYEGLAESLLQALPTKATKIKIFIYEGDHMLNIQIIDNGKGFDMERN